jgi:hypothetical protein
MAQAIGGIAAVIIAVALAWVASRQAHAADEQAIAAKKQATSAEAQIFTSLLIADKQASPNISISAAKDPGGIIIKERIAILNNGAGAARDLRLKYRDANTNSDVTINNNTLVVRDSLPVSIDGGRANTSGLTLTYSTIFGTQSALDFNWDTVASQSIDEKLSITHLGFDIPVEHENDFWRRVARV